MVFSETDVVERMATSERYGYWLAIKHVTVFVVAVVAAYVTWNIPTGVVQ